MQYPKYDLLNQLVDQRQEKQVYCEFPASVLESINEELIANMFHKTTLQS